MARNQAEAMPAGSPAEIPLARLAGFCIGEQVEWLPEGWKHAWRLNTETGKKDDFYIGPAPLFAIRCQQ